MFRAWVECLRLSLRFRVSCLRIRESGPVFRAVYRKAGLGMRA